MKKIYHAIPQLILLSTMLFCLSSTAYALDDYTLLAPIPGIEAGKTTTVGPYLKATFYLSIAIAATLAFAMITFGGITYAVSDSITGKSDGKEWIENAIWGLMLVIGAWVILNTINPKILNFNLTIDRPSTPPAVAGAPTGGGVGDTEGNLLPGYTLTALQVQQDAIVRGTLKSGGVDVNNGPCIDGGTKGCTNVLNLPTSAEFGAIDIKSSCGESCVVQITGGTEGGHTTHGPGQPVIDLSDDDAKLNDWVLLKSKGFPPTKTKSGYLVYTINLNGRIVSFLREPDHWHVTFSK